MVEGFPLMMQNLHGRIAGLVTSTIFPSTQVGFPVALKKYLSKNVSDMIPTSVMALQMYRRDIVPLKGFPYTFGDAV